MEGGVWSPRPSGRSDGARAAVAQAGNQGADARRGLAAAGHAELLEEVVDVVLDGRHLDVQPRRDLLVGEALVDQLDDLDLPGGEVQIRARPRALGGQRTDTA